MPLSLEGPRLLLRRLREVMAKGGGRQARLDEIVKLIAASMNMAVCSVYLKRSPDILELYATEGLKPESVHKTRLHVGEGLVGDIALHARPLNLADARVHPLFAARPETGEEAVMSFVGVPILRGGTVIGVLVVQNTNSRSFVIEEIEALQTVAMVIAEMLVEFGEAFSVSENKGPKRFKGLALTQGSALGHVVLHEPRVEVERLIAEDVEEEYVRLDKAIYKLRQAVDELLLTEDVSHAGEHLDVLETYKMFANDIGWQMRLREAVRTGLTAEAAVERVQSNMHARLQGQRDVYLRERLQDFEDLSNRLLRILTGRALTASLEHLPKDTILVARSMGPAELLDYQRKTLRGLIIEEGTQSAHVTIVARALDIPFIGRIENIASIAQEGQEIILDADSGECFLDPSPAMHKVYQEQSKARARKQKQYARLRNLPAVTKDGEKIDIFMNGGLLVDLQNLTESGADGIGLFRTELQFMIAAKLPRQDEQIEFYKKVLKVAGKRPVIFRILDIGGDKILPYMRHAQEENPAMGWRAMRMALDRPGLLRYQIRALLQAGEGRIIRLMFPMIAEIEEFIAARDLLNREIKWAEKLNRPMPREIHVGTMLEVPSLIWQLDALLPQLDFISIGTNDLLQFFFASDRGNPLVGDRYDLLSPAALSMLGEVAEKCTTHKVPALVCGEVAGRPLESMMLLALGYRRLSVPATTIGPVKRMIRSVHMARLRNGFAALRREGKPLTRASAQMLANSLRVKL
ncbi:MAG: phosphoenolpyruvate--protein phosphotransferase [Alphaproteobacteria bacterium]|nr:phosphoenolpyruvate--protein phosphotransferase [Alphaproteobacteria bacterium]